MQDGPHTILNDEAGIAVAVFWIFEEALWEQEPE